MENEQDREHLVITPFFRIETPPLGMACLQAYLKQYGIKIGFTDYRLKKNTMDITSGNVGYNYNFAGDLQDLPLIQTVAENFLSDKPLLDNIDEAIRSYIKSRPISYLNVKADFEDVYNTFNRDINTLGAKSLVAFTTYATNIFSSVLLACMLKRKNPDITIAFGGAQTTESEETSEILLRLKIADVVGLGDGEEVLRQIIEADRNKRSLAVDGTLTFDHEKGKLVRKTAPLLNIQSLPCPDFTDIPLAQYGMAPTTLPLYTSRGCPYKCEFCNDNKLWERYRRVKVEQVIEWMHELNRKYGTYRFFMADSLLNTSKKWTDQFASELIAQGSKYQWYGMFRVDNIDLNFAKKLKRSGLCRSLIGAEAYNVETLERMRKQATPADNARATEAFCAADIPLEISNVIGFPGETEKDFQAKLEFYFDLSKNNSGKFVVNAETFRFVPGSGIYNHPDDFNIKIINWNKKTIKRIPEISSVVARLPMAIKSNPGPRVIKRWADIIRNHFTGNKYTRLEYQNSMNRGLTEILIENLEPKSMVNIPQMFSLQEVVKNKVFQINHGTRTKCLLSPKEAAVYRTLQGTRNVEKALEALEENKKSMDIKEIQKFLIKLLKVGILANIRHPMPKQEPEDQKPPVKIIQNVRVT